MKCRFGFVLGLALAVILSSPAFAGEKKIIEGRVVGKGGGPISEYQVAKLWTWSGDQPQAGEGFTVDDRGRFRGEIEFRGQPEVLIVYADDAKLAGVATVTSKQDGEVVITVEPSVRVHGRITCSQLGGDVGSANSYWMGKEGGTVTASAKDGVVDLRLPRGEWEYFLYGGNIKDKFGEIKLGPDKTEYDMGVVDLPATFIALNRGKKVDDWNVTAARGVPIDRAQVKHYKGKWLLVEFWGFW